MSLHDFSDLMVNEKECKDRSLSEWNFGNSVKYWSDQSAQSSLDLNDVSLELVECDSIIQNSNNAVELHTDNQKDITGKLQAGKNVQERIKFNTLPFTKVSANHHQEKNNIDSINLNCNEYPLILETSPHMSRSKSAANIESNLINNEEFASASASFSSLHSKDKLGNTNMNIKNVCLPPANRSSSSNIKDNSLRRYCSTLSLKEPDTNSKAYVNHSSHPLRSKSHSLSNLSSHKSQNYDNIQSKVGKYIQERKRESKLRRKSMQDTKSLPVTPIRSSASKGFVHLNEDYLDTLYISSEKLKKDLPEDLKQINQEILSGNCDRSLVEKIFNRLKKERECRINQDIIINAYQLHYDNLLWKYAEAKNDLDKLRFNKDINCSMESSQTNKTFQFSSFKKAFSTSNLCPEYELESAKPSNLARYSSSPQVHAELDESFKEHYEKFHYLNENLLSCSTTLCKDVNDWLEKFDHIWQKLKEFVILENNSALNKDERETIWKYILKLYSKLSRELPEIESSCKLKLGELSKNINAIAKTNFLPFSQNFPLNDDDSTGVISASGFCENTPANSSYRKFLHESQLHYDLDFSKANSSGNSIGKSKLSLLKYSNARDADSGCPPSDRSARNSHFPSIDSSAANENLNDTTYRGVGYNQDWRRRRQSIENLCDAPKIRGDKELSLRRSNYLRSSRSKSLTNLDDAYDASGSEFEDSVDDEKTRKHYRKKPTKSPKTTKYIGKYEDKFICREPSIYSNVHSSKYEGNKHVIDMSQMERNSKYFEHQVKDLKVKGLQRKRNEKSKRYSLPNRPNTPLKVLTKDSSRVTRIFSDVEEVPKASLVSNDKRSVVKRPTSSLSVSKNYKNEDLDEELKFSGNSCSPLHKNRKKISTSTPNSSYNSGNFEFNSVRTDGRYSLPHNLSLNKIKSASGACSRGFEVQEIKDTEFTSHNFHPNHVANTKCGQTSCGDKTATSTLTMIDGGKLIDYLNKVTVQAENVRVDSQESLNLFRSRVVPRKRH